MKIKGYFIKKPLINGLLKNLVVKVVLNSLTERETIKGNLEGSHQVEVKNGNYRQKKSRAKGNEA